MQLVATLYLRSLAPPNRIYACYRCPSKLSFFNDSSFFNFQGGSDTEATNNIGRRPIHIANDPESLQLLLDHGADVDSQDRVGNAAIHFAVLAKDRERVEILLDKGCDITVRNRAGSTPLHLATGDTAITQLLLSKQFLLTYNQFL